MKTIILCDLDGTLADCTHRLHFIDGEKKDWPKFFEACNRDKLIPHVKTVIDAMVFQGFSLWITSGRSRIVQKQTIDWLLSHELRPDRLFMRNAGDTRPDDVIKQEWIKSGAINPSDVLCAFDDRQRVVDMWRANGIPCLQVAKGDF